MSIAIIVPQISSRLVYTFDWVFVQQLGVSYSLLLEIPKEGAYSLVINYSNHLAFNTIPNCGLLLQEGIQQQKIEIGEWNNLPTLFTIDNPNLLLPFDIFSAIFFLISRYEEYLPFSPDKHHRFPASASILYNYGLLQRPIVDEWIFEFGLFLQTFSIPIKLRNFKFQPTYDIDIAWSFKNKGIKRIVGGYLKDALRLNFSQIEKRNAVLFGNQLDPYDSFDFIEECHQNDKIRPIFFFLLAAQTGLFDKNIAPFQGANIQLIERLSQGNEIGIHPSYNSNNRPELFGAELGFLNEISKRQIVNSRQHFIKVELPNTYHHLLSIGITDDYSMGYSTDFGFRAGTSHPFFWYDLQKEKQTELNVHPFSFMDVTAHFEKKLTANAAFEKLLTLKNILNKIGGMLTIIMHNFSLGSEKEWKDWKTAYQKFLEQTPR